MKELLDNLDRISTYAPKGTKRCESQCDRECITLVNGYSIVCHGCSRVVMEENLDANLNLLELTRTKNKLESKMFEEPSDEVMNQLSETEFKISDFLK